MRSKKSINLRQSEVKNKYDKFWCRISTMIVVKAFNFFFVNAD